MTDEGAIREIAQALGRVEGGVASLGRSLDELRQELRSMDARIVSLESGEHQRIGARKFLAAVVGAASVLSGALGAVAANVLDRITR